MMHRPVKYLLWITLAIVTSLVFILPDTMIAPGRLLPGHSALERDCFACHTPFLGSPSEGCLACHKAASIGVTTSKGVPLTVRKTRVPFHQKLLNQDCVACHSDHSGVATYRVTGRFSHQLLDDMTRGQCIACHPRPVDDLHRQVSDTCSQCHTLERWKPATFEHEKLFALDRDHNVKCVTCHSRNNYKAYTCYGCHEHSVKKVRKEHLEEGIREFDRCVLCHRNADEDDAKRIWRSGRWRDGTDQRDRKHHDD
jgi:hypothetical protein